jgi:hypothetical protein
MGRNLLLYSSDCNTTQKKDPRDGPQLRAYFSDAKTISPVTALCRWGYQSSIDSRAIPPMIAAEAGVGPARKPNFLLPPSLAIFWGWPLLFGALFGDSIHVPPQGDRLYGL